MDPPARWATSSSRVSRWCTTSTPAASGSPAAAARTCGTRCLAGDASTLYQALPRPLARRSFACHGCSCTEPLPPVCCSVPRSCMFSDTSRFFFWSFCIFFCLNLSVKCYGNLRSCQDRKGLHGLLATGRQQ
jgi:hypothetical protein